MGKPLPGLPVVLVDPLTGELVEGVGEGELCLDLAGRPGRPLSLMTGYQGDDERNAEAMAGGFYHTGDVASRDEDGYITYVGRTDDVFKASDYKISPFELESVLIEHPGGGRGGRRTRARPGAARGAQGVRRPGPRLRADRGDGLRDPEVRARAPARRTSGSAASSSSSCPRRSPARSAASSCAAGRTTWPPGRRSSRRARASGATRTSRACAAAERSGSGHAGPWPDAVGREHQHHVLVGDLVERGVPPADADERLRRRETDHLVGLLPHLGERARPRPPGPRPPPGGRPGRGPRRRRPASSTRWRCRRRRPPPPGHAATSRHRSPGSGGPGPSTSARSRRSTSASSRGSTPVARSTASSSTRTPSSPTAPMASSGLAGHAELAHHQHVEGQAELRGHLGRDRHPAPGHGEHQRVVPDEMGQVRGQPAAGVRAVQEAGHGGTSRGRHPRRRRCLQAVPSTRVLPGPKVRPPSGRAERPWHRPTPAGTVWSRTR